MDNSFTLKKLTIITTLMFEISHIVPSKYILLETKMLVNHWNIPGRIGEEIGQGESG